MRNRNIKLTILIILLICLGIANNSLSGILLTNENFSNDNETNLKNAGSWELSPFIIDDGGGGDYTWAEAVLQDWCRGSGTSGNPYIIENLTIHGNNAHSCITIKNSNVYFIIRNCTLYNSSLGVLNNRDGGIKLFSASNGKLIKNHCHDNNFAGIILYSSSNNNLIINNTAEYNWETGIYVDHCSSVDIIGNNVSNNGLRGVFVHYSSNINITGNFAHSNDYGIQLASSNNNFIMNNTVYDNQEYGIPFSNSHYNLIKDNIVYLNYDGIRPYLCEHNIIRENIVNQNTYSGIYLLYNSQYNTVFNNNVNDNNQYGIHIWSSNDNDVYMNYIRNSGIYNSKDDGTNNNWDNGIIGNYWDDYTGVDADDDGIGDTPYNIDGSAGNQDDYPIWRDVDDVAPQISINSPSLNDITGKNAPYFNIEISDQTLNSTWYRLWNGTKLTTNNTFEYLKDDQIEQDIWNEVGNGTVTITFFANDSIGRLTNKSVTVRKDIYNPVIIINEPKENELFGIKAPNADDFIIIFDDPSNIDATWYMLSNATDNTDNYTWNGYINQAVWEEMGNGSVIIKFYANDSAGNIGLAEVTIRKDFTAPTITINSPALNELFGTSAPSFNVEIGDTNLDTMWYTLDNGLTNTIFTTNGTINQSAWDALSEGNVIIRFYANDSAGNIEFDEVTIRKDVTAPIITINNPRNSDVIGATAPNFDLSIEEPHLDYTWYSLNGGNNITFTGLTGTINQALWDALPEGNIIIRFYANDTLGRIEFAEVTIRKDVATPTINIISPTLNEPFGTSAPHFNVEIYDANLDSMWYTLDNGLTNTTFTTNGTINQSVWDALPDGNIIIKFYANDSAGNFGFVEVSVVKDATAPTIVINSPTDGEEFGNNAPSFNIVVTDDHLDMVWYSFDGGLTTYTTNTSFNQLAWSALPEGSVTITFYANDTLGNEASEHVTVVKMISQPSPPGIPGYNILLLLGIISTIVVIIVKKRLNHLY